MTQLPTPPASRQTSEIPDGELKQLHIDEFPPDPSESLDALLERYLHLLDKHQRLQSELSSELSSGFLSLAHANYTCPPGRRYGADYYDERMKASRRVTLQPPSSTEKTTYNTELDGPSQAHTLPAQIFAVRFATSGDDEQAATTDQPALSEPSGIGVAQELSNAVRGDEHEETTAVSQVSSKSPETEPTSVSKRKTAKRKPHISDPIRWYGILVPPSLRRAQKSFIKVVESSLLELASVMVEMQTAEKEISRLRKELGRQ